MPVPLGEVPGPGFKYRYFAQRKDSYDLIFIGSSRVFHHFIPEQFDRKLAEDAGQSIKSFNFGYDAMWPPESYYMLREALRLHPQRLRWVLIDLMQIQPKIDLENATTLRMAYWHDLEHTMLALRALPEEPTSNRAKFDMATGHIAHLVGQWVDRGRSSDWLARRLRPPDRKKPSIKKWEPFEGYETGHGDVIDGEELRRYNESMSDYRRTKPPNTARAGFLETATKIASMVRASGAEPIFVLAPTIDQRENVVALLKNVTVFSFADPVAYPALYDPQNHYDSWHLNHRGAEIFTNLLAERFAKHLAEEPSKKATP
jgi:hypothetical protein